MGNSLETVRKDLEEIATKIFRWLELNQLVGNADKSQLILNNCFKENYINVLGEKIFNSESAKILGVTFDNNLNFEKHINKVCNEASKKISALARIAHYMS